VLLDSSFEGRGNTPDEAYQDLYEKVNMGNEGKQHHENLETTMRQIKYEVMSEEMQKKVQDMIETVKEGYERDAENAIWTGKPSIEEQLQNEADRENDRYDAQH
jgi:molecular chaperone DnaK (HSP70)